MKKFLELHEVDPMVWSHGKKR